MTTTVDVHFDAEAEDRFLRHTRGEVPLDDDGKGSFEAIDNEPDLIVYGMLADEGTTATLTLSVAAPARLDIAGHPIEGRVAQGKRVWGGSRFFEVKV